MRLGKAWSGRGSYFSADTYFLLVKPAPTGSVTPVTQRAWSETGQRIALEMPPARPCRPERQARLARREARRNEIKGIGEHVLAYLLLAALARIPDGSWQFNEDEFRTRVTCEHRKPAPPGRMPCGTSSAWSRERRPAGRSGSD